MAEVLSDVALDQLFRTARTQNAFLDKPVEDSQLRALYDLLKWGPTAANSTPARIVFVKSKEAKAKLAPALSEGNLAKTLAAPVTAIIGFDQDFHEKLPYLFPHADAKSWFDGPREGRHESAFRNGSLQGAYLILAARALGLDAGPMSGFDAAKVDEAFFAGTGIKTNFLVNLGYGDPSGVFPRLPRLSFDEAARIE
ncbi:nitroreductase [Stenotrophomonas panacihumi]|uniref:Putative NADH dehydrogenase/NAD(P)H nitroreductase ARC20_08600 n=1 Tax=Stenotrophomonas panacihumi TaxID=676599 RepID=A0A0R0AR74_9GAMM|nr:malonic semialdehyde reductase [Stenotrophomonas panacihumi]KRG44190.1 nitroreductase [Stenotrophomonas panacihumi]PTN56252.1 malonic semialdehyde reductase [Stenotrophomonas panacihumi]